MLSHSPVLLNQKGRGRFILDKQGEMALLVSNYCVRRRSMRLISWLLTGILGLAATGCSNNELILKKQTEMDARMEQLVQANAAGATRLTELSTTVKELQGQLAANTRDLEALKSSMTVAAQRTDVKPVPAPDSKIVVVGKGGEPGDGASAEQDAYMNAFGLFSANNYDGAVAAFEAFIKAHPASEYAGNAQYWIGECYYTQRDYTRSLEAFNKVIENYPYGKKVPDALLKVGYSLISLNEHKKAQTVLETLVEKYPKSPAAAKARERLSR
jgi:tol-pal system protein YbgF